MIKKVGSSPSFLIDPYDAMRTAIDIALQSDHPVNKIGATLFSGDWAISQCNTWPDPIRKAFPAHQDIGNSSGTIHAETACLLHASDETRGASLCITDPFCPNCAKNIAEAGIKKIYIDEEGFEKDFFKRRENHFTTMSMQICEKAGISIYKLSLINKTSTAIYEAPDNFTPPEDSPIDMEPIDSADEAVFKLLIENGAKIHQRRKFAVCFAEDKTGQRFALTVRSHAVRGYTMKKQSDMETIEHPQGKYSYIQEPVNRLLMGLARKGLMLIDDYLYCSQVPTSREQVNLVGAGIQRITIGDLTRSRDADGLKAMQQLSQAGIISYV